MVLDHGRIRVERVIIHDLPRNSDPILSEVESNIDQALRNFIQEHIRNSLASRGFSVALDPNHPTDVHGCLLSYLGDEHADFVEISHRLAHALVAAERTVHSSAGLLAVVATKHGDSRCLAIVKLEREEGINLRQIVVDGRRTFDLEILRSLMFTNKTQVFKVGHFVQEGNVLETIAGEVADLQNVPGVRAGIAEFFLVGFLGCDFIDDPQVATRNLFNQTINFIEEVAEDPTKKLDYMLGLQSAMRNNANAVRPVDFAGLIMRDDDRQRYIEHLRERNIDPDSPIAKDVQLIRSRLRVSTLKLESGIEITGSDEAFREHAARESAPDGTVRIVIQDRVNAVRPN